MKRVILIGFVLSCIFMLIIMWAAWNQQKWEQHAADVQAFGIGKIVAIENVGSTGNTRVAVVENERGRRLRAFAGDTAIKGDVYSLKPTTPGYYAEAELDQLIVKEKQWTVEK